MVALSAGPPPVPFASLTADRLATAIQQAHHTNGAARVAELLGAERGVDRACDLIEGLADAAPTRRSRSM